MQSDPRDYKIEISSLPGTAASNAGAPVRPFLGVHFRCCGIYARIYRQPGDSAYRGACPRCGKRVTFAVGSGGTDCRFFTVE